MKLIYKDMAVELSIDEFKELTKSTPLIKSETNSLTSNIDDQPKKKVGYNKLSLTELNQVKDIKRRLQSGQKAIDIARSLNINPAKVYHWKYNTPKELVM